MSTSTVDILNRGKECLTETMGVVDAEFFISIIIRERFDYTKWQRQYYDEIEPGEFHDKAVEYARNHPYTGKAERL